MFWKVKENWAVSGAGLSKCVQKEVIPATIRPVAATIKVHEGYVDEVRVVNEQLKPADRADNVSLSSNKKDDRWKTLVRVGSAQKKQAEASGTFGSCLDKTKEGVGAPNRVLRNRRRR